MNGDWYVWGQKPARKTSSVSSAFATSKGGWHTKEIYLVWWDVILFSISWEMETRDECRQECCSQDA
jgi:hypothetical protein